MQNSLITKQWESHLFTYAYGFKASSRWLYGERGSCRSTICTKSEVSRIGRASRWACSGAVLFIGRVGMRIFIEEDEGVATARTVKCLNLS